MFSQLWDSLLGCGHKRYSFPLTVKKGRRNPAALLTGTYVVCLDCGKEFAYDWKQMKVLHRSGERIAVPSLATKEAA